MNAVLEPREHQELLIGCGNRREKIVRCEEMAEKFENVVTLDIDPDCKADVIHDLNELPYPFADDQFDEIHVYDVLEHCGTQGDWRFFFAQFGEFHRILKPGGFFCATMPMWDSPWAWADPGHTRVFSYHTLAFLTQEHYKQEVGKTASTDYRHVWDKDFEPIGYQEFDHQFGFILKATK